MHAHKKEHAPPYSKKSKKNFKKVKTGFQNWPVLLKVPEGFSEVCEAELRVPQQRAQRGPAGGREGGLRRPVLNFLGLYITERKTNIF